MYSLYRDRKHISGKRLFMCDIKVSSCNIYSKYGYTKYVARNVTLRIVALVPISEYYLTDSCALMGCM